MKRYLLFAGSMYYPRGGMEDYIRSSDSLCELTGVADCDYDWWHIYDSMYGVICDKGTSGTYD